jgi:tetratricopeptide (TPR) repeat protein
MSNTLELAFLHADACSFSAAMAANSELAVQRLKAGQSVFDEGARRYGGQLVNMVGDSMLFAFNSTEAAYRTAQHCAKTVEQPANSRPEISAFDYRMGITKGRVTVHDRTMYGHCINMSARIGSLVGRNHCGLERKAWDEVRSIASGSVVRERILFAKPDEPHLDFVEVCEGQISSLRQRRQQQTQNEAIVVLVRDTGFGSQVDDEILDAFMWNASSYFSAYGWQVHVVDSDGLEDADVLPLSDYVIRCKSNKLPSGYRLFAAIASRHLKRGQQTFSRDTADLDSAIAHTSALVSLVGSAISHAEIERAAFFKGVGAQQLVAAGRDSIAHFTADQFAVGMKHLAVAQKLAPDYPLLLSSLARAHAVAWRYGWTVDKSDSLGLARSLANKAVKLAPEDARCEADLAFVKFWANEPTDSAWHYERSIDTLPYHPELSADAGMVFSYIGQKDQAASVLERSIANLPTDADYRLWSLGDVYFAKHDYRSSLKWLSRMSDQSQAQRLMAANKVRLGLDPSEHVANVLALQPDFSVSRWVSIQPFTDDEDRTDFEEALLMAGLPP